MNDTVFAPATPLGGAISIIRISGSESLSVLEKIFTGKIRHSYMSHGKIHDEDTVIDDSMAVYFKSPHSYTGEDMAELYIHGGVAVSRAVLELLLKTGIRAAEAGEFSRRAFLNGKMSLSQAEAVMDLISASAKRSATSAILQLSGDLNRKVEEIENMLIDILTEIDATIDYPDEMEGEESNIYAASEKAKYLIDELIEKGMKSHRIRDGFVIAIVGEPNAGKSSLLNALVKEDRAIVTDIAGTTRDIIEADADFCGLPVHLMDTAGLHDTQDKIERMGIDRAIYAIDKADLVYVVIDPDNTQGYTDALEKTKHKNRILVISKQDIAKCSVDFNNEKVVTVSAKTGYGIEELKMLTSSMICPTEESGIITNMRHIEALQKASECMTDALSAPEIDCMASDIRDALSHISKITGRAVDEDIITNIFSRFCVGK